MSTLPVRTGPGAFVERQLEAMSPRDRKLLVGLVVFFGAVGILLLWWTLYGLLESRAQSVRDVKARLVEVQQLQKEYQLAAAQVQSQEERLGEYAKQPVTAYIEQIATNRGVIDPLRKVQQSASEEVGNLKQTTYTVELKRAEYEPLMSFLYDMETGGYPAFIETAKFKTSYEKRQKRLDLTLDLVVFSLSPGGS